MSYVGMYPEDEEAAKELDFLKSRTETGSRIKSLLRESGYTVRDIQNAMGFENPQAVYKWISGKCLPSLDNFLILSRLLNTSIEDILVIDGDIPRFRSKYREIRERLNRWYNDKIVIL